MQPRSVEGVGDEHGQGRGGSGRVRGGRRGKVGTCEKMCHEVSADFYCVFMPVVWVGLLEGEYFELPFWVDTSLEVLTIVEWDGAALVIRFALLKGDGWRASEGPTVAMRKSGREGVWCTEKAGESEWALDQRWGELVDGREYK